MLFTGSFITILGIALCVSFNFLGCSNITASHGIPSSFKNKDQYLGDHEKVYSYFCAGYFLMLSKDWEAAALNFEKAFKYDHSSDRIIRHLATCYFQLGKNDRATDFVEKLVRMKPQEFNVRYTLATLYENSGKRKDAIAEYERASQCKTTRLDTVFLADTLYRLANLYMQEGMMEKGVKYYQSLFEKKLVNEPAKIYYEIGLRYFEKDDVKEASKYFSKAKEADPKLSQASFYLVLCYDALDNYENAVNEAMAFLEKHDDNWVMHLALSDIYGKMKNETKRSGEIEKTREILKRNVDAGSKNPKEYFLLSQMYKNQQQITDAIAVVENMKLIPMDNETTRDTHFLLANLYYENRQFERVEEELLTTLKLDPDFHEANNFLGYFYVENNKYLDKALDLINRALKAQPKNGAYLDSLGWAYYKKAQAEGRNDYLVKALQMLLEAVQLLEEPDIYEHIGDVHYSLGNWDNAVKVWERAETLYGKKHGSETQIENIEAKLKKLKRLMSVEENSLNVIANHTGVGK